MDVFQYMCLGYAIAAFIEYAAVNYFTKLLPVEGGTDEEDDDDDDVSYNLFHFYFISCLCNSRFNSSAI